MREDEHGYFDDLDEFDEWVAQLQKKRVFCEGVVADVRPNIILRDQDPYSKKILRGFLVRFNSGYIDDSLFEDHFFLSLSVISQNQIKFRSGDQVEFEASLTLDRGRFKFIKCGKLVFFQRGTGQVLNKSQALVNMQTATIQQGQPLKCMQCLNGILADIEVRNSGPHRSLVCLAGEKNHKTCTTNSRFPENQDGEICAAMRCHHTL